MDHLFLSLTLFTLISLSSFSGVEPITFKFINKCRHTIWPGLLSGAGTAQLPTTGFYLNSGKSRTVKIPRSWSGRVWGRTLCSQDRTGKFSCLTGDCGSGKVECLGSGAQPPATLAEFTLNGADGLDFYDVSLVDGYNLPMLVIPKKVTRGGCGATGCLIDLNGACPKELRLSPATGGKGAVACRSACEAFGDPRFCCSEGISQRVVVNLLKFERVIDSIIEQSFWKENAVVESSPSKPEIAGVAKRWGGAPTCEQDYDVPTKPWCFISRCGSTAISCWRRLYSNGTFALSATFISLVTNVGLDTFRQIVALNSRS
ncbi:hypothetical protein D5086_018607 [Populus alba]|uniref:Uncharacterized protein n=1 Tax=Populus alba TaxID=43335 RepID=A0ACC4BQS5_POPAL